MEVECGTEMIIFTKFEKSFCSQRGEISRRESEAIDLSEL